MLSDKIKGKSALKAQTFLLERDKKVHVCYWLSIDGKNSAGSNIFQTSLAKCLPISSISDLYIGLI